MTEAQYQRVIADIEGLRPYGQGYRVRLYLKNSPFRFTDVALFTPDWPTVKGVNHHGDRSHHVWFDIRQIAVVMLEEEGP